MKTQPTPSVRIWTLPFVLVILISLASTGVVDALQAALPVVIQQSGGSSTLGGLTVTVFALAAIIPSMLAGTLADSYGCRKIMLFGAANVLPPAKMGEGIGYFGVGQSLSLALGPMSGLVLASCGNTPMWSVFAVVAALILILAFFCRCNRENPDGTPWQPISASERGALCGGIAIDALGFDHALCAGCLAAIIPALLGWIFLRKPQPEIQ